jgi:hypothetical protein
MADYPTTPVALSTIDETTPTQSEDAAKLGDALRQTRALTKSLLGLILNDDGTIKDTAITSVADGAVTTDKLSDGSVTALKVADAAITTSKVDDLAITTAKIADTAITTSKITDANVTEEKIADSAVTTDKLGLHAVTSDKLSSSATVDDDRAVSADHIKNSAVTTDKLADKAVTPAKISNIGSGSIIVGNGTGAVAATISGDVGGAYDSLTNSLVLTIGGAGGGVALSEAVVIEKGAATASGGSSTAATFVQRPAGDAGTVLTEESDPVNILSIASNKIQIATAGTYQLSLSCSAYSVGTHMARLVRDDTNTTIFETAPAAAPAGVMNNTYGEGSFVCPANGTVYRIEHWTEFAKSTNGFGLPAGITGVNNKYVVLRLSKVDTEDEANS